MSCGCDGSWVYNGTVWAFVPSTPQPSRCDCPPSPDPPWARSRPSPNAQTILVAGAVSLTMDPTLLVQNLNTPPAPVAITIPNGNLKGQSKQIYIPSTQILVTETFNLSGTFAGLTGLTFNTSGFNAMLIWDGSAWQMVGGNAIPQGVPPPFGGGTESGNYGGLAPPLVPPTGAGYAIDTSNGVEWAYYNATIGWIQTGRTLPH